MATNKIGRVLRLNTFWSGAHLSKLGVSYFIDNECSPQESKKIWEHLMECAKCRLKVGATVSIDRLARNSIPKPSSKVLSELRSRLGLKL